MSVVTFCSWKGNFGLLLVNGSTSVERRQWSAVSGAPSMERELIERCVCRAPSVER